MSQAKVDQRKAEKKNVKKEVKKQRILRRLTGALVILVLLAVLGWAGYSIYANISRNNAAETEHITADISAIESYLNELGGYVE